VGAGAAPGPDGISEPENPGSELGSLAGALGVTAGALLVVLGVTIAVLVDDDTAEPCPEPLEDEQAASVVAATRVVRRFLVLNASSPYSGLQGSQCTQARIAGVSRTAPQSGVSPTPVRT